jgi:hypothetical protein
MSKRVIGALAGFAAALAAYGVFVERTRIEVGRFTVHIARPGLPPAGVTILHLSDFHFRENGRVQAQKIRRLLALLEREQYDILALTGDLTHNTAGLETALGLIRQFRPRLGAYSVPGNHDYCEYSVWGVFDQTSKTSPAATAGKLLDFTRKVLRNELVRMPVAFNDMPALEAALRSAGVEPLVNQARAVPGLDGALWIAGIDDLNEGAPNLAEALADVPETAALILLAHDPDAFLDPAVECVDLVLSGHTHGGQVRLPVVGAAHTQGTHLTRQQPAGWFRRGRTRMFVSRGLGESIPLRLGVRPQVALITLIGEDAPTPRR